MRKKKLLWFLILVTITPFYSCQSQNKDDKQIVTSISDSLFKVESFYLNNQKKSEYYLNKINKLNGKYYEWDEKGIKLTEWNFVDGVKNGEQYSYWGTGKLSLVENYYYGNLNGKKTYYDDHGKFILEEIYTMGKKISTRESEDYYKPLPEMLKVYTSRGIDSVTATKILREGLSGYIIETDSGTVFKYDKNVANILDSLQLKIDSLQMNKKIILKRKE